MTHQEIHTTIQSIIAPRLFCNDKERQQSLQELLALTVPNMSEESLPEIAAMIPAIPATLYEKWITSFAERLIETIPYEQVCELCSRTEDNDATLGLIFLMFMESERMEKIVAEDLSTLGSSLSGQDATTTLGLWLKQRMTQPA